ncbi:MAG: tRNA uridine-5-carboxymethylaminomethyl(34) synthesis GTPase MnmE [Lentisphaerae bacterium]|nr:tRNA uridine-5-carboxymethylaminomethyl(34) synthesis GTPase MnmE [Lentisphaerota bacterium]
MNTCDNIAAPATAVGGAVTIIRLSGPGVLDIANKVWQGIPLSDRNIRKMVLGKIAGDQALAVYMKAPASYTGDDVVEFQCHGGAAAADAVMRAVLNAGCRLAEPGEFTCRAFINGKLDLLQAEAVADIISSGSDAALKMAEKQLDGVLSSRIGEICDELNFLRSECEARLDFPDEELDFDDTVPARIDEVMRRLTELLATHRAGAVMRDGVQVVLAGRPNAGKSSLLNRLLGFERAIVSNIPGTTRDTVREQAVLRNIPVYLTDTAGLRESADPVEKLGIERSYRSISGAEVTFWLLDASAEDLNDEASSFDPDAPGVIPVWNKCDLASGRTLPELPLPAIRISAAADEDFPELLDEFERKVLSVARHNPPEVAVNARSASQIEKALPHCERARQWFEDGCYELCGCELASAAHAVGVIIGRNVDPDLLDAVFHRFCLGK